MARTLWLLRHGEAEPHGARPDAERRLTARGSAQAQAAGVALLKLGCELEAIYTSPRERALATARLAAPPLGLAPIEHAPLGDGFDVDGAQELVRAHAGLLLVGHEPDLSGLIYDLCGGQADMKKGGIAGLRLRRGGGELLVLLRPHEIAAIAGS